MYSCAFYCNMNSGLHRFLNMIVHTAQPNTLTLQKIDDIPTVFR